MLIGLAALLLCQLLGELIARLLGIPVPGAVIGMVLLLAFLLWNEEAPAGLREVAEGLLRYLALLFIPAGVGLMVYGELIRDDWQVMAIVLVVSTLLTVLVTAVTLNFLLRRAGKDGD